MDYIVDTVKDEKIATKYLKFGTGKKNLIIIPGISIKRVVGLAEMVVEAYKSFADDYTIYLFDRKENMPKDYTVEEMSDDLAYVLKLLKVDKFSAYGCSQGGMIALNLAINYPDMVEKIVLVSSSSRSNAITIKVMNRWMDLAKKRDLNLLCESFAKNVYRTENNEAVQKLITAANQDASVEDLERFWVQAKACLVQDTSKKLDKIKCPILVIGAYDDKVLGGFESEYIAKKLNCELVMLKGYGHAVYDEAPEVLVKAKEFLDR